MSYLNHLKRSNHCESCRWIVKYNDKQLVREVKLVYNPEEYSIMNAKKYGNTARKLHSRQELIEVLDNDKEKRK